MNSAPEQLSPVDISFATNVLPMPNLEVQTSEIQPQHLGGFAVKILVVKNQTENASSPTNLPDMSSWMKSEEQLERDGLLVKSYNTMVVGAQMQLQQEQMQLQMQQQSDKDMSSLKPKKKKKGTDATSENHVLAA